MFAEKNDITVCHSVKWLDVCVVIVFIGIGFGLLDLNGFVSGSTSFSFVLSMV
ncbi:hypothetical protein [Vibrio vulnificus YJ016]|uniref:Uncharacterized protein n=2 Tax=Vibrio vulnificus TaxID=672 RepID=Q7MJY7_VIBVY|nr:hypothetical protein FORC9_1075 [Vibrio vulnificus]BAC94787.1 hypothetical protein [Vibrio vulnificus YJ016]ANH63601.1 hypothetical protein FORC16_1718 [Vibrio vulnificus]ANN26228.1 hypothetical protein FORC17_1165 [Vibrio vulnificus]AXX59507.1 hypothetical protein FORC53_1168 [Vibrio vulnificus]